MIRCDECQARLLDYQYGLLEPAEAAAVEGHLAACPDCPAALADTAKTRDLFARAAKLSFPEVKFEAPAEPVVPAGVNAPVPARPAAALPRRGSWAVAAVLLIAVGAAVAPVASDWMNASRHRPEVVLLQLEQAREGRRQADADGQAALETAQNAVGRAEKKHDLQVKQWVAHDLREDANKSLTLTVTGPAAAVPGAPNDYVVEVLGRDRQPVPAEIEATVRDAAGAVVQAAKFTWAPTRNTIHLPAALWQKVPAGDDLILHVAATDPKTGARATLAETIRLQAAVLTTFLTTDKPLYHPGEPVFFRSATLDRATLRPPPRDLTLRYEIVDAKPQVVATVTGRAEPVRAGADGKFEPVPGPDGKPVRGIGSGVFQLSDKLPGGEYTLRVFEVPANHPADQPPPVGTAVLAARKFTVLKYTAEKFLKTLEFDARTYGPGDTVRAKVTVRDQGKPAAGVLVLTTVTVNGNQLTKIDGDFQTAPDGTAKLSFALPSTPEPTSATVTVKLMVGATPETIVRPVPLASKSISVEFFPEGGDLVTGVPCRVYFRATTPGGKPADVTGYLSDGTRSILPVKTVTDADAPGVNQGSGVFRFTPERGKRYYLKLLRPANVAETVDAKTAALLGGFAAANAGVYPLPRAVANGVGMTIPDGVIDAAQPIRVTLHSNDRRNLYVGAYTRGLAVAAGTVTVEPGRPADIILAPKTTAGGVTRVTVFEEPDPTRGRLDLLPVAERLIFRRPAVALKLGFAADRKSYGPGDGVKLDLTAANEKDEPTAAILYVAVVNQSVLTMADDKAERMLPAHYLLAGEVQKPDELEYADFFLTAHPKAAESLDVLLGTQGWRRFAEQTPGRFRSVVSPEDQSRFLVSAGLKPNLYDSPEQADSKLFVPEYREAAREYAAAKHQLWKTRSAAQERSRSAAEEEVAARKAFEETARTAIPHFDSLDARRGWLVTALILGCLAAAAVCFPPVRRRAGRPFVFTGGALGIASVAGFVLIWLAWPFSGDWREQYRSLMNTTPEAGVTTNAAGVADPGSIDPRSLPESGIGKAQTIIVSGPSVSETDPRFRASEDLPPGQLERILSQLSGATMPDGKLSAPPFSFAEALNRANNRAPTLTEGAAARRAERQLIRHSPFVVREYAHTRTQKSDGDTTRTDFTETIYWQPLLVLPNEGKASVRFHLSDSVQAYRVLVAGTTLDGRLGAASDLIEVRKPLAVDVKLPIEVTSNDRIDLPVTVANATAADREVRFGIWSDHLKVDDGRAEGRLTAPARGSAGTSVRLAVLGTAPVAKVRVHSQGGPGFADAVERTVAVSPDGFPAAGAISSVMRGKAAATVTLPEQLVPGTLVAKVVVYTNPVAEVLAGLDGLLREPHGCFEQSSAANYPNVLTLEYLREIGQKKPTAVENARGLLERGYARLAGYEVAKAGGGREGFEWFGQFPPHEALTAYGLMQFADMARVYPVDPGLLARTREFLLSRRDGTGGFRRGEIKHDFGDVPAAVANAYILWALTEAERHLSPPSDLGCELAAAERSIGDDPYPLALVANARLNRGDPATDSLTALAGRQHPDGAVRGAATTITRSHGPDAVTETTALAALAWLKAVRPTPFEANARRAIQFLHSRRGPYGAFGSTQATILALKALTEYARSSRKAAESGRVVARVGGREVVGEFAADDTEPLTLMIPDAGQTLSAGENRFEIECTGKEAYPFTIAWSASTRKPTSDPACVVRMTSSLGLAELAEGTATRVNVKLENTSAEGQGMAVAVVGLPGGLRLPPDLAQLKALAADGTVSFWEQAGRELIFYWRGLAPKQAVAFSFDVVADVPGEFRGPAGRAYLYYHPQAKNWVDPLRVRIRPAIP